MIGSGPSLQATDEELADVAGREFDRAYRPAGIARQYAAIVAQPRWHQKLGDINVPTLVLHGQVDTLIIPENGRDVAARIPNAQWVEVEGWGHDMPPKAVPILLDHVLGFTTKL